MRSLVVVASLIPLASALISAKNAHSEVSCTAADLKNRMEFQNKLAGVCEDMCKEVGAYPKCAQCPDFVTPDSTPGVTTWPELLEHMDNLVQWGQDTLKGWRKQASALQKAKHVALSQKGSSSEASCAAADLSVRMQIQNKLAGVCEDMCKEVGAYPKCAQCPDFVEPDSTPGVTTWPELLEHMDNLVAWGKDTLKGWRKQASALQESKHPVLSAVEQKSSVSEQACVAEDLSLRVQFQNKLAGVCEDMCKEVGAYPKCAQCPEFVTPDSTPGVTTWPELLEHMDNLVQWGQDTLKGWRKQASALQKGLRAVVSQKSASSSCVASDLTHRMQVQNKLAGVCEDMCKEVGAYPKCAQCPEFVEPDSTPGVTTWPELLEHMDNLVAWGKDTLKGWRKQASALQESKHPVLSAVEQKSSVSEQACVAEDLSHRAQFQNKLAGVCEDMCKEVGAYPKCAQCPEFVTPDSTPGVTTWPELLEHMDNLVQWGQDTLKGWRKQASALQKGLRALVSQKSTSSSCLAADSEHRMQVQNKLAGVCEDMCKEVGAYPKCAQCPEFVEPDSTPGVTTWPELLEHMDNLVAWGKDTLKGWRKQASALQTGKLAHSL